MTHQPERTCVGCRGIFEKKEVVRIVAGPAGVVIDYREKLPGRAAYVCPTRQCIEKSLTRDTISKALRLKIRQTELETVIGMIASRVKEKAQSLLSMAAKAGKLAAGYSAVQDALEKGRAEMILYARDLSEGTKQKVKQQGADSLRQASIFTKDELGAFISREQVGVMAIEDKGLADAVWRETERLKSLINISE